MIELLEKPAYGSPCNGCGQCCIAVQCPVSTALFGEKDICPALVLEKGTANKFACGLMVDTAAWGGETLTEALTLLIGAGIGCDGTAEDEEEPTAEARHLLRAAAYMKQADASDGARALLAYFRGSDLAQGMALSENSRSEVEAEGRQPGSPRGECATPISTKGAPASLTNGA